MPFLRRSSSGRSQASRTTRAPGSWPPPPQGAGGARPRRADGDQASRSRARTGPSGEPVPLLEQNRARWDGTLIRRGLAALERAEQLAGAVGPYALQAAIAACHARARTPDETDWERIAAHYDALAELARSPVVELNRAVALGMAFGPAAGLDLVDQLTSEPALEACCQASAPTCSPSSAASTRLARSWSARPRSPETSASASSCSSALGRGPAGDAGSAGEEIFPSLCRERPACIANASK